MILKTPLIAAFAGETLLARGPLAEVVARCKTRLDADDSERVALFDDENGRVVDVDFSGEPDEVMARLAPPSEDEAAQDEAAQDEAAQDEAAQDEAAQNEAAQDEAAQDEAAQDEAAQDEAARQERRGPGRPKLGVVCREVSLLPRHWAWLAEQPGSASATLRRLVEAAKKDGAIAATRRRAIDAAHRFLWDIAGNQPNFEEATRALFAADFERLDELTVEWPPGIREQLGRFVDRARL